MKEESRCLEGGCYEAVGIDKGLVVGREKE